MKIRLDQAVEDYLAWARAEITQGTLSNHRGALRKLIVACGKNIYVSEIGDAQVNASLELMRKTRTEDSMIPAYAALNAFFGWSDTRNYLGEAGNPMARRRMPTQGRKQHVYLPAQDYPRLLANAQHPRDRILYAIGWELVPRSSELTAIRVGEYNRKRNRILIHVKKKRKQWDDDMLVTPPLEEELDRWMRYYTDWAMKALSSPVDPSWYLVPAKERPFKAIRSEGGRFVGVTRVDEYDSIKPTFRIGHISRIIRRGLVSVGFPDTDPITGKARRIGEHDMRRSGALALYERLVRKGVPNAIQVVQNRLHHESEIQTRGYIGIDTDKEYADSVLSDPELYDDLAGNVTDLGEVRAIRQ